MKDVPHDISTSDNIGPPRAGMVPFYFDADGTLRMLVYRPEPLREAEDTLLPWQFARGTIEDDETPKQTAMRELQEELGLTRADCPRMVELGTYEYDSYELYSDDTRKKHKRPISYDIHWLGFEVMNPQENYNAQDAKEIRWMTIEDIRRYAAKRNDSSDKFKLNYLSLAEHFNQEIHALPRGNIIQK